MTNDDLILFRDEMRDFAKGIKEITAEVAKLTTQVTLGQEILNQGQKRFDELGTQQHEIWAEVRSCTAVLGKINGDNELNAAKYELARSRDNEAFTLRLDGQDDRLDDIEKHLSFQRKTFWNIFLGISQKVSTILIVALLFYVTSLLSVTKERMKENIDDAGKTYDPITRGSR